MSKISQIQMSLSILVYRNELSFEFTVGTVPAHGRTPNAPSAHDLLPADVTAVDATIEKNYLSLYIALIVFLQELT